jgi:hypothetical protein
LGTGDGGREEDDRPRTVKDDFSKMIEGAGHSGWDPKIVQGLDSDGFMQDVSRPAPTIKLS